MTATAKKEQDRNRSCKARWATHKNRRITTIRKLFEAYKAGDDSDLYKKTAERDGVFTEFGLSFDYVAPGTFTDQREGYWRYQLSWGGPSDEFRFYSSAPDFDPYRIEYWFLDWGDGHGRKLVGSDDALMNEIWYFFSGCGSTKNEFDRATQGE